eukprot:TRINITY_DN778318_c0_g1_i1.p1 TRINITY_DN778318_c0_g1~~TRINITY_DN778318_c0_g1_i1.p1  ORF type:complete len:365 (-),score=115.15 TRINITY_DN778318_c0_g1_i1:181-1275(-)
MKIFFSISLLLVVAILLSSFEFTDAASGDFYDILGVPKDASGGKIKKAFRKLSLKYHPDKNPGDEVAKDNFMKVNEAYEVLSDSDKRRVYDQGGEEALQKNEQRKQQRQHNPFGSMFGFGQQEEKRGADAKIPLQVTLKDVYVGREFNMKYRKQVLCPKCRGTGADDPDDIHTCPHCNGQGVKVVRQQIAPGFVQQFQQTCDHCHGKGKIMKSDCKKCHGHKVVPGDEHYSVVVERGMKDGDLITFENASDEHPDHAAGHLHFLLRVQPHKLFIRNGNDLRMKMEITLKESLLGFKKVLTHLDDHEFVVRKNGITRPGEIMALDDEGMPNHEFASEKGRLYIEFIILFPKTLSSEQKKGFAEIF